MVRTVDVAFWLRRDGARYGPIHPVDTPTLRCSDTGEIKTALSGEFLPPAEVDWLRDEIEPVLVIDGKESPLGRFLPATVTESRGEDAPTVRVEAYDRCWVLRDTKLEAPAYYPATARYLQIVETLLTEAGIAIIQKTPSTLTLAESRADWQIGTSYLRIVNDLLAEINYKPVWFDASGAARLEPVQEPTAANLQHTLSDADITSLLLPELSAQTDVFQQPNVFVVYCSNPDKTDVLKATAVNNNPQSPLSVLRRGRRITSVTRLNNIAGSTTLQEYADRLRNESMFSGIVYEAKTGLFPGWGVDDVTALHYGEISALCREIGWTMELRTGGTMTHRLERIVTNLG